MKDRKYFILGLFFLAAILLKLSVQDDPKAPDSRATPSGAEAEPLAESTVQDSEVARPESQPGQRLANLPPSPLDDLRHPDKTGEDDVRLLALLFSDYTSVFKRVPLGMHTEIVAAFQGDNPRNIRYIPEGHPAVNDKSQIVDRWDRPFFFHVISKNAVEIISAGRDGELFTADDIRNMPPHASVEPDAGLTMNQVTSENSSAGATR